MTNKIEKIRDYDGDIRGYRLGKYYLKKHYIWGNQYEWLVCTNAKNTPDSRDYAGRWRTIICSQKDIDKNIELKKALDNGKHISVLNCKYGKQALLDLNTTYSLF